MSEQPVLRAAQYVRMSREHQRYSIASQSAANAAYALESGFEIVRTYTDAGISGLSIKNRQGLKSLLADVLAGDAGFDAVLVYDVSRWGRFQDPDQGAHYEFVCREAGVQVCYTAEPFANDGSLTSTLVKQLKRAMAAEYVRDLSAKVHRAQRGLAGEGYWMGGPAPYGMRRRAVAPDGTRMEIMQRGQWKALVGHRSVLVEGPEEEVAVVRRVYSAFVVAGLSIQGIVAELNAEQVRPPRGDRWTSWHIRKMLSDEAYIGTLVFGRRRVVLKQQHSVPRTQWLRVRGACPQIVRQSLFDLAARNIRRSNRGGTDEELLAELRGVLARHGRLSDGVISRDPQARSAGAYIRRFGSLARAYEMVGYAPSRRQVLAGQRILDIRPDKYRTHPRSLTSEVLIEHLRTVFQTHGYLTSDVINSVPNGPRCFTYRQRFGSLRTAYALVGYVPSEAQAHRFKPQTT